MNVDYAPEQDCSATGVGRATGRGYDDWFAVLDAAGGPAAGRRALGEHLIARYALDPWWVTTLLVEYENARAVVGRDCAPAGYNICVTKAVAAQPARVYEALLDTSWWLGGTSAARPAEGGAFADGDGHSGVWKKLTPGKVIRFTWEGPQHPAGETVEIKLAASGARTSIVLNHNRLRDRSSADGMRVAWGRVLESLKGRCA